MTNEVLKYVLTLTFASSVAILAALLIRRAVRRVFGSSASYWLWLVVPIAMGACLLPGAVGVEPARQVAFSVAPVSALSFALDRSFSFLVGASSSTNLSRLLFSVWVVGAVLFLAYMARLQRTFMSSLGALSGSVGVLRAEGSAGCPALVGVFKPRIILPADFKDRYTLTERVLIIAHERVHLRRGDCLWNSLVALNRCLFWFNPLVHAAANVLRMDQELACDAVVMRRYPNLRRTYANAMLKTQLADGALPAGCHWRSVHPLKGRLEMLKQPTEGPMSRASGRVFVAVASLAVSYGVWNAGVASEPVLANKLAVQGSTQDAPGGAWLERGLTLYPVNMDSSSVTTTVEGGMRLEHVRLYIGAPGDRLQITADHGYGRQSRAPSRANVQWTFTGNVTIERGTRSYHMESVVLRFSPEGLWLEPGPARPIPE
jgi:bla regulator protein blaR1